MHAGTWVRCSDVPWGQKVVFQPDQEKGLGREGVGDS